MRIGIDCRAFQGMVLYAGVGTYSFNLIQALIQVNGHHQLVPFAAPAAQTVHGTPSPFDRLVDQQGFRITGKRSLLRQLESHRVDVCHLLELVPPFAETDQTVVTVYDLIPLVFPKAYLPWYGGRFCWNFRVYFRSLKRVRHIVAISHHTKADLIRLLGISPDRIAVIYPGISPVFRPLSDPKKLDSVITRYGIRLPFLLYVGAGDYRKNLPGLLRAFARLQRHGFREFQLVLAGKELDSGRLELLESAAGLGITSSLHLLGYVPLDDLVCLYNAATVLVYPSFYEGFGFPPLEAMACGTPVITSRVSSLPEITGDAAVLVNPRDVEELAEAMRRVLLDAGLRETLSRKGIANASRFTWTRTAQETIRAYEGICG